MAIFNGYVNLPEGTGKNHRVLTQILRLTASSFSLHPSRSGDFPICSAWLLLCSGRVPIFAIFSKLIIKLNQIAWANMGSLFNDYPHFCCFNPPKRITIAVPVLSSHPASSSTWTEDHAKLQISGPKRCVPAHSFGAWRARSKRSLATRTGVSSIDGFRKMTGISGILW